MYPQKSHTRCDDMLVRCLRSHSLFYRPHCLKEIYMKALPEGQYIKHYRYGMGVVTESDDRQTSIDFDLHGLRRFVTTVMVVELSNVTPPTRERAKPGSKVYARLAPKTSGKRAASKRIRGSASGGE